MKPSFLFPTLKVVSSYEIVLLPVDYDTQNTSSYGGNISIPGVAPSSFGQNPAQ